VILVYEEFGICVSSTWSGASFGNDDRMPFGVGCYASVIA
jgi:hypothetical protein